MIGSETADECRAKQVISEPVIAEPTFPSLDATRYAMFKSVFDVGNVKSTYRALTRTRPGADRLGLCLCIAGQALSLFVGLGTGVVEYQFCQKHFNWTYEEYSDVASLFAILQILVPFLLIPFLNKVVNMPLHVIGMIGSSLSMSSMLIKGSIISESGWYVASAMNVPSSMSATAIGAQTTTFLNPNEVGSVMACLACVQAIVPFLSSLIVSKLFDATLNTFPGLIFLLAAFLVFLLFCIFVYFAIVGENSKNDERQPLNTKNEQFTCRVDELKESSLHLLSTCEFE
ncbi:hypothetical protein HDE_04788 [Halotydeus destructor]|nr:hypothetical protein HDE_04788 [Halotydeus destructor]